jgi:hypothetical protein
MDESKEKDSVWQTIQALNRAWTIEGNADNLKDYFHGILQRSLKVVDTFSPSPCLSPRGEGKR